MRNSRCNPEIFRGLVSDLGYVQEYFRKRKATIEDLYDYNSIQQAGYAYAENFMLVDNNRGIPLAPYDDFPNHNRSKRATMLVKENLSCREKECLANAHSIT